jgi:nucleotide-binding universal stress UspA family protein
MHEIKLLHVANPLLLAPIPELGTAIHRQLDELIAQSVAEADARLITMDPQVLWDDKPADAVERWVNREDIGVIVLGTHGGGTVERALIGSMAYSMARLTPCPVLLVPPLERSVRE